MNKDILIFGKGFIGERLQQEFDAPVSQARITSFLDAEREVKLACPKLIINTIGHIGRNVDDCELDKDKTLQANAFVPLILAEVALRNNIRFVHISSGCIYHYDYASDVPIDEERPPDFYELFYSRTKIYSEQPLNLLSKKYPILIARIRVPLDSRSHPKNLLNKLINFRNSVSDIPNSVSYIPDSIAALRHLIAKNATGVYNLVNKGALRYDELLEVYKKYVPGFDYHIVDFRKLNLVRTNLILSTNKLKQSGFKVRDIHEVLEECVQGFLRSS